MCSNPGKVVTIYQFSELFASAFVKAFTPRNITSSFRVTGVFPPNRKAIPIPGDIESLGCTPTANIAEKHGIEYLPFHTPRKKLEPSLNSSETLTDLPNFTDAELQLFQRRFEEGYDIKTDNRYNLWLEAYHPQPHLEPGFPSVVAAKPSTTNVKSNDDLQESSLVMISSNGSNQQYTKEKLSDYLVVPTPPGARKLPKPPKHAKVLTSAEYLAQLDEKEREKKEKEAAREQKRIEREERKKINAAKKTQKLRAKAVQSNKARKNADGREAMITYGEVESETVCFPTGNSLRTTNTTINNQEKITSQPHLSSTDSISVGNKEKRYHTRQRAVSTSEEHEAENEENAGVHVETNCSSKVCPNPRARSWIQCCLCSGWFHCTCAGVLWRDAKKDDYVYKCSSCSIVHSVS